MNTTIELIKKVIFFLLVIHSEIKTHNVIRKKKFVIFKATIRMHHSLLYKKKIV